MSAEFTAERYIEQLQTLRPREVPENFLGSFKADPGDTFIGVPMGKVFELSKAFIAMPPAEIDKLLDSQVHEVRVGALSIMDKQGRSKKTPASHRKEIFDLYLRRHDRINNWDLVDLGAPFVIGAYLFDKPRDLLYTLARSANQWERRTAIVSTAYFIRQGDLDDTFAIAELLVNDDQDLVQKAAGGWLREAGKQDQPRLLAFLDRHAATMPRTFLRYAIEHLDKPQRDHYLGLKKAR